MAVHVDFFDDHACVYGVLWLVWVVVHVENGYLVDVRVVLFLVGRGREDARGSGRDAMDAQLALAVCLVGCFAGRSAELPWGGKLGSGRNGRALEVLRLATDDAVSVV